MARVAITRPEQVEDPVIREIFSWVTSVEGAVPNHFYVEMNFPEFLKAKLGATRVLWEQGELALPEIQHIGILVEASLVTTVWRGREKLHFINPVPLHEVYERWVRKFERQRLRLLHDLKNELEGE